MVDVSFDGQKAFRDFRMVMTTRNIPLPEPKTYMIDVPGADGSLDLSTALTDGEVKFKNRELTLTFQCLCRPKEFATKIHNFSSKIHGKVMKVIFDDRPTYYFTGRCTITEVNTESYPATVTVTVDAEPYLLNVDEDVQTFTFSGEYGTDVDLSGDEMNVVPIITVSKDMTVVFGTREYSLFSGDNVIPDLVCKGDSVTDLTFKGSGAVTIKCRSGCL